MVSNILRVGAFYTSHAYTAGMINQYNNQSRKSSKIRKCKIIATLGPSSETHDKIYEMIKAGMDIARLNLSHGSPEWHHKMIDNLHAASFRAEREVGILIDIPGSKLRIQKRNKPLQLRIGEIIQITPDSDSSGKNPEILSVYPASCLPDVFPGDTILIGDGTIELQVVSSDSLISASVIREGIIKEGMGVVVPGRRPDIPYAGDDLKYYIHTALSLSPDYIALSFVGSAQDIRGARAILNSITSDYIPVLAKIENREAISNLMEIIRESDGVMVARGDLGAHLPIEQVPHIQKKIISCCNKIGIPVITATEMLESMVHNTRPTRAEVTDVAHAIIDGTDATMLSAETSLGDNPVSSVLMMNRIAYETEQHLPYLRILKDRERWYEKSVEAVISHRACYIAEELSSPALVAFTRSGLTAERVSRYRPRSPVIAITSDSRVAKRLLLFWGVLPVVADPVRSPDELFLNAKNIATKLGIASQGDQLVIIAGNFAGKEGRTNMIKVEEVS